jgi:hypothetical protein
MWDVQERDGYCEEGTGQKNYSDVIMNMMMMMKDCSSMLYLNKRL